MMYAVVDNFGEEYGEFETFEKAEECKIELLIMDSDDPADYRRRKYNIVEVKA